MGDQRLNVKTVGVIGAGVSGVATAIHLRKAGLDVKVFERNPHIGGVWYVKKSFTECTNFC
jgi:phytoene dehydrogenase-like protein